MNETPIAPIHLHILEHVNLDFERVSNSVELKPQTNSRKSV